MIIKYFDKGKGRTGPVEYILNKDQYDNVQVLKGNPYITAELIKTNNNKLKYHSGVIAFEEQYIDNDLKQTVIDMFERSIFTGLEKDQYNTLFVELLSNSKTKIHFIIPRLELTSGKAYNPHWHKVDQARLILLQDFINNKYNLSNPFAAKKANTLEMPKSWDNKKSIKEKINKVVSQAIAQGQIENRDQVAEFLQRNGLEVKRTKKGKLSKNFILVKEQTAKNYIQLKGVYYNESFTSTRAVERELTAREERHTTTTSNELRELEQKLEKAISRRARYNNENYPRAKQKQIQHDNSDINSIRDDVYRDLDRSNVSAKNTARNESESNYYQQSTRITQKLNNDKQSAEEDVRISQESTGVKNDRIRATFSKRARERAGAFEIVRERSSKDERGLQSDIERVRKYLRESYIKSANYSFKRTQERSKPIFNEARKNVRERRKRRRAKQRFGDSLEYFGSTFSKFSTAVQEQHKRFTEQLERCNEQSKDFTRTVKEVINKKEGLSSVIDHFRT